MVQQSDAFAAPASAAPVEWKNRRWADGTCGGFFFKRAVEAQEKLFDWQPVQDQTQEDEDGEGDLSSRGIRRDLSAEPDAAFLDRVVTPQSFLEAELDNALAREENPVKIRENDEQMNFLALLTCKVQELLDAGYRKGARPETNPDMGTELPPVKPIRVFLGGPGGAGKSECIDIAGRMIQHFFGARSKQVLAASNSAARGVGGSTVHSGLHLGGQCSFRLHSKTMKKSPSPQCEQAWAPVKALFLEEVSMISPTMLAGISYRLCRAREAGRRWLDSKLYEHEDHMFGGIPIVVMLGDFMQLGAMEKGLGRVSLIMNPKPAWYDECFAGRRIFWRGITHVVMLRKTHRFKDEDMPRFLEYMRNPGAGRMPAHFRAFLKEWEVLNPKPGDGERNKVREWRERCERGSPQAGAAGGEDSADREPWRRHDMAIAWQAVQRLLQYRAVQDARAAKQLLLYCQAVETCSSQALSAAEYRRALQVVNMNTTGKLLGFCPLYKGMRVRLTAKLSAKYGLVHDAIGTVEDFILHERDLRRDTEWQDPQHEVRQRGFALLKALPVAVLVKFKGFEEDVGYGKGVVVVEPHVSYWKYRTHENLTGQRKPVEVSMARRQIPLAPESVRTVQTAQGMSMDAAMIFLGKPGNMDLDDYWMHLYVMMSRVRRREGLLAFDMPPEAVFERGPPPWVADGIAELEKMGLKSSKDIAAARHFLGWPALSRASDGVGASARRGKVPALAVEEACGAECLRQGLPADPGVVDMESGDVDIFKYSYTDPTGKATPGIGGIDGRESPADLCPDVSLQGSTSLLSSLSAGDRLELGFDKFGDPQGVSTSPQAGVGFANPECAGACFVNAPLQLMLRLQPVSEALRRSQVGASVGAQSGGPRLLDVLAGFAQHLRGEGSVLDSRFVLDEVYGGRLGKVPAQKATVPAEARSGDASAVLLGESSGHVRRPGLVDLFGDCFASKSSKRGARQCPRAGDVDDRGLLRRALFGGVVRERQYCRRCDKATDVLRPCHRIDVSVTGNRSSSIDLEQLLRMWGQPSSCVGKCVRGCAVSTQPVRYLEKEPPVLVVVINRKESSSKYKCSRSVVFKEVLDFPVVRSGRYTLAGVLQHHGARDKAGREFAEDGHFVATCALGGGGGYVVCNDGDVARKTWGEVTGLDFWRSAHVLVYALSLIHI